MKFKAYLLLVPIITTFSAHADGMMDAPAMMTLCRSSHNAEIIEDLFDDVVTRSPISTLDDATVNGYLKVKGPLSITGKINTTAAATFGSSLVVTGLASLTGNARVSGTLSVSDNANITGDVSANDATFETLVVNTNAIIGGNQITQGTSELYGATTIGTITGTTDRVLTVNGQLFTDGTLMVSDALTVDGRVVIGTDYSSSEDYGDYAINAKLSVDGDVYVSNNLEVDENVYVKNTLTIEGDLLVDDDQISLRVTNGRVYIDDDLEVDEDARIRGDLYVSTDATISGTCYVDSDLVVDYNLSADGNVTHGSSFTNGLYTTTDWNNVVMKNDVTIGSDSADDLYINAVTTSGSEDDYKVLLWDPVSKRVYVSDATYGTLSGPPV